MDLNNIFRGSLLKLTALLLLLALILPAPAFSVESEDSRLFITGFNAYQQKDYNSAIESLSNLLRKYPATSLKDMTLFWLAKANHNIGRRQEAAKYMAQFLRDYPESPLKATVDDELLALAAQYEKGEPIGDAQQRAVVGDSVAAEKALAEKAAADKAVAEKAAAERSAAERTAAEKAAAEKAAAQKAAAERAAAERTATEKAAAERAAAERAATERAAAERAAAERAAAEMAAAETAVTQKAARQKASKDRKKRGTDQKKSAALREEAIAAYQDIVKRYPGTPAAAKAAERLKQLGVEPERKLGMTAPQDVAQVFTLEVTQYADLDVNFGPIAASHEVGKPFTIPMEIVNTGNGSDSFYLESGFPPEYNFRFAAVDAPGVPITSTPVLAVGEKFRIIGSGTMPRGKLDRQKNSHSVRIVSVFAKDVSQSREIALLSSAPLLRAAVKGDQAKLQPGEKVSYRVSLMNLGSAAARGVTMRVIYPPQYEPVVVPAGFKREAEVALVLDELVLKPGETLDHNLAFRLRDEALADQELFLRADVVNSELDKRESFVSATSVVQRVSSVTAKSTASKMVVIPGQTVFVPLIVANTGNVRELSSIKSVIPANVSYTIVDDLNRDGKRQSKEPIINHVGPLSPREEAYVILQIDTPASAIDGSVASGSISFEPETGGRRASVNLQLAYSRPIVELTMNAQGGKLKPGELLSLELTCFNRGSNLAKQVALESTLPAQLELVAAEPPYSNVENGVYTWRFDELGAGEKRNIKVTYRVKPGIAVGTNMQLKNLLNYQDPLGNKY